MKDQLPNSLKRKFQNPRASNSADRVLSYVASKNHGSSMGVHQGETMLQRFKVIFSDGRVISIPYAYLPVFILVPDQSLTIRTNNMEIIITGRNLQKLEALLSQERIEWIKENNNRVPVEEEQLFISKIEVDGNLLL